MLRLIFGHFDRKGLRWYLAAQTLVFWGLILFCLQLIPDENHFGFASHPFSYLGGFGPENNPRWWRIFSGAMIFWAVALIPVVFYLRRRFAVVSKWGSLSGAAWLLLGCAGIFLVGVIPTGHAQFWGTMSYVGAHRYSSVPIMMGFGFGIFWHELMLFADRFKDQRLRGSGYWKYVALYAAWWGVVFTGIYFLVRWVFVYERMKREAAVTGRFLAGSWTEALNTIYSIPLWENILIISLFVFMTALPLMVSMADREEA